jgi:hypothetical protein
VDKYFVNQFYSIVNQLIIKSKKYENSKIAISSNPLSLDFSFEKAVLF